MSSLRLVGLTALAMIAFAANSVITRLALAKGAADPAGFTALRVLSAAGMLMLLLVWRDRLAWPRRGDGAAALGLFIYMAFFSFAYLSLEAGTGALILFGTVQLTMFGWALVRGERFGAVIWAGLAIAMAGLVWLVAPGVEAPDPFGALLMAAAGVGWGVYSLRGAEATDALGATAGNFLYAALPALALGAVFIGESGMSIEGAALAVLSGALASACGYAIWYSVVPGLGAGRAATVQLSVPAIAAIGGVAILAEPLTLRLAAASATVLGGVGIALSARRQA